MYLAIYICNLLNINNLIFYSCIPLNKEVSDLSFSRVECPRCGAIWLNGQHYWKTGQRGDEETLSNLVCGLKDFHDCLNPSHKRGHIYGEKDTWEKRSGRLKKISKELDDAEGTDYSI